MISHIQHYKTKQQFFFSLFIQWTITQQTGSSCFDLGGMSALNLYLGVDPFTETSHLLVCSTEQGAGV